MIKLMLIALASTMFFSTLLGGTIPLSKEFFELKDTVKTPFTSWLKPYRAGKLKTLFLVPRFGSREVIELSQRLDLDHTVIMFRDNKQIGDDQMIGAETDIMLKQLTTALEQSYELIVIGNVDWQAIPEDLQYILLKKVSDGAGLVYCSFNKQQQPEIFKELFTPEQVPFELKAPQEKYDFHRLRNGKILLKHGFGGIAHHHCLISKVVTRKEYEIAMSKLIKGMILVSGKYKPTLKMRIQPSTVEFDLQPQGQIELTAYDEDFEPVMKLVTMDKSIAIPDLPGGKYSLVARLFDDSGNLLDYDTAELTVSNLAKITDIALDREFYTSGDTAILKFKAPNAENFIFELIDNYRRIIVRREFAGTEVSFEVPEYTSVFNYCRISSVKDSKIVYSERIPIYIHSRQPDGFLFGSWISANGNSYLGRLLGQRMAQVSFDSALWTTADANLRPMPIYSGGLNYSGESRVRKPCLTNPNDVEKLKKLFQKVRKATEKHHPIGYTLGDEPNLSVRNVDVCTSPTCLEHYRSSLLRKFENITRLNKAWSSNYNSWDEIMPDTLNEAVKKNNYSSWLTHRLNMDQVLNEYLGSIQETAGNLRIGAEGIWRISPRLGINLSTLPRYAKLVMPYPSENNLFGREAMSSFTPREALSGGWMGSYNGEFNDLHTLSQKPWMMLLHNANSVCWYAPFSYTHLSSLIAGILPDYRLSPGLTAAVEQLQLIKSGIDRVIFDSQRTCNDIAVLYSQPSMYYAFNAHDNSTMLYLLEDLGWNYRLITTNELNSGAYKALILDNAICLSNDQISAIREFAANNGVVIANVNPATHTEDGIPRSNAALADITQICGKIPSGYPFGLDNSMRIAIQQDFRKKLEVLLPSREADIFNLQQQRRLNYELIRYQHQGFEIWGVMRRKYDHDNSSSIIVFPEKKHLYMPVSGEYLGFDHKFEINVPYGPALLLAATDTSFTEPTINPNQKSFAPGEEITAVIESDASEKRPRYFRLRLYSPDNDHELIRHCKTTRNQTSMKIQLALNEQPGSWTLELYDPVTGIRKDTTITIKKEIL